MGKTGTWLDRSMPGSRFGSASRDVSGGARTLGLFQAPARQHPTYGGVTAPAPSTWVSYFQNRASHNFYDPFCHYVRVNTIAALACVAASALFVPAYAHTLDSVGEYRLELQWAVEPPYSGEVNTLKLYVSPLVPGLELAEQPFQNGVEGLEDTIKIQLANRDYMITLLPEADDWIPGLYNAHVKVLRPGFYQANILGQIGETVVSLSMHPHEVRDAGHITFPDDYGEIRDILVAQEALRAEQEALGAGVEAASIGQRGPGGCGTGPGGAGGRAGRRTAGSGHGIPGHSAGGGRHHTGWHGRVCGAPAPLTTPLWTSGRRPPSRYGVCGAPRPAAWHHRHTGPRSASV